MKKKNSFSVWEKVAKIILRNKIAILCGIGIITILLAMQWKNLKITFSEANMLPETHAVSLDYQKFREKFGEEGNLIVIGADLQHIFTPENIKQWNALAQTLEKYPQVQSVLSTQNIRELVKDTTHQTFALKPFFTDTISAEYFEIQKQKLLNDTPFYEGLLFNAERNTLRMVVALKKEIVNTAERKDFILNHLQPIVQKYETRIGTPLHTSGMPYIRTLSTEIISGEIGIFIAVALGVTCLIFFLFFRSFRVMFISMCIVIIGVMWAFGFLGLFGYEITILTSVIPPLIIVIGLPNCIFLINRYQQEIKNHGYKAMALQRVIAKVGNVTLLTNLTTAAGFATFALTKNKILVEFGVVASVNILCLFIISLCIIPILHSFMPMPKERHLKHLEKKWLETGVEKLRLVVKNHRFATYCVAVTLLVISIIGVYRIKVSGTIIEDMPKSTSFFEDIVYFENRFGGIMPLEITIDAGRKNGIIRPSTLQKMNDLQTFLDDIPEISQPISIVQLIKYAKQAYYNGNPEYFELPTPQERNFILSYVKKSSGTSQMLNSLIDSTGQTARITVFMKDIGSDKIEAIEENIHRKVQKIFPAEEYKVTLTGKAYMFSKGTSYLVENLIQSLFFTIFIIAGMMLYMFRSWKMVVISLIPNLLPLLTTAGIMGYLGIPLKPSTILVFGIAFGIAIDDTIHFLAKYRQELVAHHWKIKRSVYAALRETGVSMFYTSVVLFFGFLVFTLSSFGGTKALGGLVSCTLFFAMLSNLVLLPSLLLSLEKSIANKEAMPEPNIDILENDTNE